jgi:hypothetical protein
MGGTVGSANAAAGTDAAAELNCPLPAFCSKKAANFV